MSITARTAELNAKSQKGAESYHKSNLAKMAVKQQL
jgi:hypothetical protein